jgi:hypothetical protein
MTKIDHTRILHAYLARLSNKDLQAILKADDDCWHAQLNYGNSGQLKAQADFYTVVSKAVDSMLEHDLDYVVKVINEELTA